MTHHAHPLTAEDAAFMERMRAEIALAPRMELNADLRPFFDQMMTGSGPADGTEFEHATVGGVSGWWVRPRTSVQSDAAILYLHGGGYVLGSATAYRNLVSQIVARAGVPAFVADYGLAPERPFPAAINDARAVYAALVALRFTRLAIAGDSAGGGLSLALLATVKDTQHAPLAVVAISPWTDLSLQSPSMNTRKDADPILSAAQLDGAARLYLGDHDRTDPLASAVFADRANLPPVQIHTGDDEVLLDDTLRYAEGSPTVEAHIWEGMVHVFAANIGALKAADQAMDQIGSFLRTHLS